MLARHFSLGQPRERLIPLVEEIICQEASAESEGFDQHQEHGQHHGPVDGDLRAAVWLALWFGHYRSPASRDAKFYRSARCTSRRYLDSLTHWHKYGLPTDNWCSLRGRD